MKTKSRLITPTLIDAAALAGVTLWALWQVSRWLSSRRARSAMPDTIHTWEGEGGNVVAPQAGDAVSMVREAGAR